MARKKVVRGEETKFGWCLDGQHDQCLVVTSSGLECECPCGDIHGTKKVTLDGVSPLLQSIIDKYWKKEKK